MPTFGCRASPPPVASRRPPPRSGSCSWSLVPAEMSASGLGGLLGGHRRTWITVWLARDRIERICWQGPCRGSSATFSFRRRRLHRSAPPPVDGTKSPPRPWGQAVVSATSVASSTHNRRAVTRRYPACDQEALPLGVGCRQYPSRQLLELAAMSPKSFQLAGGTVPRQVFVGP